MALPLTCIAYFSDSTPNEAIAAGKPPPNISPIPLRSPICFIVSKTALLFPNLSSIPPVSSNPIILFSKHSIAKAIIPPVEIVSRPYALQSSFAFVTILISLIPRLEPSIAIVSYSGPP